MLILNVNYSTTYIMYFTGVYRKLTHEAKNRTKNITSLE